MSVTPGRKIGTCVIRSHRIDNKWRIAISSLRNRFPNGVLIILDKLRGKQIVRLYDGKAREQMTDPLFDLRRFTSAIDRQGRVMLYQEVRRWLGEGEITIVPVTDGRGEVALLIAREEWLKMVHESLDGQE